MDPNFTCNATTCSIIYLILDLLLLLIVLQELCWKVNKVIPLLFWCLIKQIVIPVLAVCLVRIGT